MSMKIGIDAHMLGDKSGGNETYFTNLISNFSSKECQDIIIFVNKNYDTSKLDFAGKIVVFKSNNAFVRNFIEIPYLMLKYRLSVMFMQYFIPFIRFCPVVVEIFDISYEHYDDIFTKKDLFIQKHLIPYAAKKSKKVITISEFSKMDICKHYNISNEKVDVIFGAASSNFRVLELSTKEKEYIYNKFNTTDKYILCVGNLQPRKNIKRLLAAYAKLRQKNITDYKLVIVGKKAWMYSDIFNDINKNSISDSVVFTDYVSDEELVKLYNLATAFVYPSIFEGFGLPVLEAMACGTVVATSNVTSIPEVAGQACEMFEPYNIDDIESTIQKILLDDEVRSRCKGNNEQQVNKFSWRKTSKETYSVLKQVVTDNNVKV